MIPSILLDIQQGEKAIDMCAAPGSKTKQILESLQINQHPENLLISNDVCKERAYMLAFQALKLKADCSIITANDSTQFPKIIEFDKVLCDVPCSGDGTIRKQKSILKKWVQKNALSLHNLQLNILLRGIFLAKKGGKIVYSTCSLNPIENEAVVSAALKILKGKIELVPIQDKLKNFKCEKVINQWSVTIGKMNKVYNKFEEVDKEFQQKRIFSTMFPSENVDNCIRISPHLNNTGGFFIALFTKIEDFDENIILEQLQQQNIEETQNQQEKPKQDFSSFKLEKLVLFKKQEQIYKQIIEFYGLNYNDQIFDRLYYINQNNENQQNHLSKYVFLLSHSIIDLINQKQQQLLDLKIINCGFKVLTRSSDSKHEIKYRINQEGLDVFFEKIGKQKITIDDIELYKWLVNNLPKQFNELPENIYENLNKLEQTGIVVISFKNIKLSAFTAWKGKNNFSLRMDNEEITQLNFLIENNFIF